MSNVKALPGIRPPTAGPNPDLVEMMRSLLERAESGDLQSFIGTGFSADGSRVAAWGDAHSNIYEMQGALVWLQHEYVHRHTGGN